MDIQAEGRAGVSKVKTPAIFRGGHGSRQIRLPPIPLLWILIGASVASNALADEILFGISAEANSRASDILGGEKTNFQGTANNTGGFVPGLQEFIQPPVPAMASASACSVGLCDIGGSFGVASGTVTLGTIRAFAQASSQTLAEGPVGLSGVIGGGNFQGEFQDQLTVVSATLPEFTPVVLVPVLHLSSSIENACGSNVDPGGCANTAFLQESFSLCRTTFGCGIGSLQLLLSNSSDSPKPANQASGGVFNTFVGDTISIEGSFIATAGAEGVTDGSVAQAAAFGLDTAIYSIDVQTPGASYISASGTTYFSQATQVPEPSTVTVLGTMMMVLLYIRKKGKSSLFSDSLGFRYR